MSRAFAPPEVLQASVMDCGPATLLSLLQGHGLDVDFESLRKACSTDVDGTSIDALETVAQDYGLDAHQAVVPYDQIRLPAARNLPAIAVTKLPGGQTHFIVLWRAVGDRVLIMDPAEGRRWVRWSVLTELLLPARVPVAAHAWRQWAEGDGFLVPLYARLRRLGISRAHASTHVNNARLDSSWRSLARLDAAARCLGTLTQKRVLRSRRRRRQAFDALLDPQCQAIPRGDWCVVERANEGSPLLEMRGAVLLRVRGRTGSSSRPTHSRSRQPAPPSRKRAASPGVALIRAMLRHDLIRSGTAVVLAVAAAALALVEILLLRGLLSLNDLTHSADERVVAVAALLAFVFAQAAFELPFAATLKRVGRRMEVRLRRELAEALPRFSDAFFETRLASDVAERCHTIHHLRALPGLLGGLLRSSLTATVTAIALVVWSRSALIPVLFLACASVLLPLTLQRFLNERALRTRTHSGGLMRFYLDAMIGSTPIRAHGAQTSVRREHESKLTEWARSSHQLLVASISIDGIVAACGAAAVLWMVYRHVSAGSNAGQLLLLVYWGASIPVLGRTITGLLQQYAPLRGVALRMFEMLDAQVETNEQELPPPPEGAARVHFVETSVRKAGREVLRAINLTVQPGEHVAIVGASGAGKSTLLGLLLGWSTPSSGRIDIDGVPLDAAGRIRLREQTAWIDPAVQLWNRPILDNITYGVDAPELENVRDAIDLATLEPLVRRLPLGLRTNAGECGSALSGGEGQRLRIARAVMRPGARLTLLDEPFRGLDLEKRSALSKKIRGVWRHSTVLCVTHDVTEACSFDRVVVLQDGAVVEDGPPGPLLADPRSALALLRKAEALNQESLWGSPHWRRITVRDAGIHEERTA